MTGEITLTGRILAIGGVKEKILAAHRNHFSHVLLPVGNRKDVEELPREVARSIQFLYVETIQEALAALFPAELSAQASAKPPYTSTKSAEFAEPPDPEHAGSVRPRK